MAALPATTADRLTDTLRSWLLHHGRREGIAADVYVSPSTVRYRLRQLRELYGERLNDPRWIAELTVALAVGCE
jgi:sugar diacid utilization regulator